MPLFNEEIPQSAFEIDPTYLPDNKKFLASILGYKNTGQVNDWGKVLRFLGPAGVETNLLARGLGDKDSDYRAHVKENMAGDVEGLKTTLGLGEAAAGVATGNPGLVSSGLKTTMASAAGAVGDSADLSGDWNIKYFKDGGEMKKPWWDDSPGEDIAMIDKRTGKKVGEVSYNERIFDKTANRKMKTLAAAGDHKKLGKFVAEEMKTHEKKPSSRVMDPEMIIEILSSGKAYGRDITPKQREFFKRSLRASIQSQIKMYDTGGEIGPGELDDINIWDLLNRQTAQAGSDVNGSRVAGSMGGDWGIPSGKTGSHPGFDLNSLGGPEQLFNAGQFITGMLGANDKLPKYHTPDAWTKYLSGLRMNAMHGYSGAEEGAYQRSADRALTAGLNNAREISGGNSSFAVGDAARFAGDYMDHALNFAAANARMKRESNAQYGRGLLQDIAFSKDQFNQTYKEAMLKKTNASSLASRGLQNIIDQESYNRNFGPGSLNNEYMKTLIDSAKKLGSYDNSIWLKSITDRENAASPSVVTGAPVAPVTPGTPPGVEGDAFSLPVNPWWLHDIDPLTGEPSN